MSKLFWGRKEEVLNQINSLDIAGVLRFLGGMEYRVRQLALIELIKHDRIGTRDVVDRMKIPYFLVGEFFRLVRFVDKEKIVSWLKLLAQANYYVYKGVRKGVLEKLILGW